ncbi:MAG: glutamyl-tRNA synthetase [Gaiellales bacterium]|nr:glutamyl-tRNA synthetase [Gaiellales bacterium]
MAHVGRYAPSPSGDLHVGNARTALLAWLWARGEGGRFLLRIEDLDPQRSRPLIIERLLEHLAAIGIDWDGNPVWQSQRSALYERALETLDAAGRVYPCFCSRADVRAATVAPHGDIGPSYPGTCRQLAPGEAARRLAAGRRASLRFRSAYGTDDHVLLRSDGVVGYQLAVVVDDGEQGVNHVLRGDDLVSSTPRQIELWQALGLGQPPRYLHVPLVLDRDGRRLGKRNGSLSIRELLAAGVSAERLVGWLAWSAGIVPAPEPVRARDLIGSFREDALTHDPTLLGDDFFA